jgi:hypothetical protein
VAQLLKKGTRWFDSWAGLGSAHLVFQYGLIA